MVLLEREIFGDFRKFNSNNGWAASPSPKVLSECNIMVCFEDKSFPLWVSFECFPFLIPGQGNQDGLRDPCCI